MTNERDHTPLFGKERSTAVFCYCLRLYRPLSTTDLQKIALIHSLGALCLWILCESGNFPLFSSARRQHIKFHPNYIKPGQMGQYHRHHILINRRQTSHPIFGPPFSLCAHCFVLVPVIDVSWFTPFLSKLVQVRGWVNRPCRGICSFNVYWQPVTWAVPLAS